MASHCRVPAQHSFDTSSHTAKLTPHEQAGLGLLSAVMQNRVQDAESYNSCPAAMHSSPACAAVAVLMCLICQGIYSTRLCSITRLHLPMSIRRQLVGGCSCGAHAPQHVSVRAPGAADGALRAADDAPPGSCTCAMGSQMQCRQGAG